MLSWCVSRRVGDSIMEELEVLSSTRAGVRLHRFAKVLSNKNVIYGRHVLHNQERRISYSMLVV